MLLKLLTSAADSVAGDQGNSWGSFVMMGVLLLIIIVFMIYNRRSQKKRQEETQNMLDAIQPGNTVKTIGGICGVVVEVGDDNTFVLETGSETKGKSLIRFDKQAVYQTNAVAKKADDKKEEAPEASETAENNDVPAENVTEETKDEE